ncbi:MAG: hypothetical protein A2Y65_04180 [Deltaproteobacteria bacterium RBG_13_52_11]|nr:MAG: hypothetical protein A2Y65_04180 [Deltaproteobacteria bacterium RBG_13_52_11]
MELQTPFPLPQEKSLTWWQRNWKWFVPVAGLAFLALFAAFIMLIITIVFGMIKSSDVYKDALATARTHPAVVKALGSPIKEGIFVMGSISVSGSSGQADLAIPISGPNGKGTIYAVASKHAGQWTFSKLVVEIKATKEIIDLIESREQEKTSIRFKIKYGVGSLRLSI